MPYVLPAPPITADDLYERSNRPAALMDYGVCPVLRATG
jgi:hypothetical protein